MARLHGAIEYVFRPLAGGGGKTPILFRFDPDAGNSAATFDGAIEPSGSIAPSNVAAEFPASGSNRKRIGVFPPPPASGRNTYSIAPCNRAILHRAWPVDRT